ncbi:hypothetical protein evm_008590 [Chilo suppressalis]|nr:hypothetical protein evm_008590 [Chilo suppressalis]
MVMVTEDESPRGGGARTHESGEEARESDTPTLHERLVAYVHALDFSNDARSGVWGEHSYARVRSGAAAGAVRVLLAPPERGPAPALLDVESVDRAPVAPGEDDPPDPPFGSESDSAGDDDDDEDWEARVASGAPHADHARLAADAIEALRRVRLARLARGRRDERAAIAAEAARLRRALAPLWLRAGAAEARPGPWLHATLEAYAPVSVRREYARLVAELRRAAPRLAERLTGVGGEVGARAGPAAGGGAAPGPWVAWAGGGRWAGRARWAGGCTCGRWAGRARPRRRPTSGCAPSPASGAPPSRTSSAKPGCHACDVIDRDRSGDSGSGGVRVGPSVGRGPVERQAGRVKNVRGALAPRARAADGRGLAGDPAPRDHTRVSLVGGSGRRTQGPRGACGRRPS